MELAPRHLSVLGLIYCRSLRRFAFPIGGRLQFGMSRGERGEGGNCADNDCVFGTWVASGGYLASHPRVSVLGVYSPFSSSTSIASPISRCGLFSRGADAAVHTQACMGSNFASSASFAATFFRAQ